MGNYPFSQKVINSGVDKMIIAGYIDIEYEKEKAYCFSNVSKTSNRLELYKKLKGVKAIPSNITQIHTFNVTKIGTSPYYLAESSTGSRSWLILD